MMRLSDSKIIPLINIFNHKYSSSVSLNSKRQLQLKIATSIILLWRIFIIK